ncbi:Uncharacterised protein [Vibrio cholerae]|nr:Uncharacterised protein [Vibrio cholerae]
MMNMVLRWISGSMGMLQSNLLFIHQRTID